MLPLEWRAMVHFLQHLDLIEQMSGGGGGEEEKEIRRRNKLFIL